jgi:four helix bundle protein
MRSHKDLDVWKKAMELANIIYDITAGFPKEETFGLSQQMRRCSVSIASNIAERAARGKKEFAHFITIARGSAAELETQLILSIQRKFIDAERGDKTLGRIEAISKMLARLLQSLRN